MSVPQLVAAVRDAADWNARVAAVRAATNQVSPNERAAFFATLAREVYVPDLTYEFSHIKWTPDVLPEAFAPSYADAVRLTDGFTHVSPRALAEVLTASPTTMRVFRLICGYTRNEFAAASALAEGNDGVAVTPGVLDTLERGGRPRDAAQVVQRCARTIDQVVRGVLFPDVEGAPAGLRSKQQKHDTQDGWESVQRAAREGVPYEAYLHQRLYGGAFRQLSDSSSGSVGRVLEDPVIALLDAHGVEYVRTGSSGNDKAEVAERFGITLNLVPDFVIYQGSTLRAFLECKNINDGGTARDKASRFRSYRNEGVRLGGVPVFAVLDGAGWRRVSDALGPVLEACDGRVFTLATLPRLLEVEPFPSLMTA